jgi:hypothetical protein
MLQDDLASADLGKRMKSRSIRPRCQCAQAVASLFEYTPRRVFKLREHIFVHRRFTYVTIQTDRFRNQLSRKGAAR